MWRGNNNKMASSKQTTDYTTTTTATPGGGTHKRWHYAEEGKPQVTQERLDMMKDLADSFIIWAMDKYMTEEEKVECTQANKSMSEIWDMLEPRHLIAENAEAYWVSTNRGSMFFITLPFDTANFEEAIADILDEHDEELSEYGHFEEFHDLRLQQGGGDERDVTPELDYWVSTNTGSMLFVTVQPNGDIEEAIADILDEHGEETSEYGYFEEFHDLRRGMD